MVAGSSPAGRALHGHLRPMSGRPTVSALRRAMRTHFFFPWFVTVSLAVLLQLCCCDLEQVLGLIQHGGPASANCCSGEFRSGYEGRQAGDANGSREFVDRSAAVTHERGAPVRSCKCTCQSRLGYANNAQAPEPQKMSWSATPLDFARVAIPSWGVCRIEPPQVRCRSGPKLSLSILHRVLLV